MSIQHNCGKVHDGMKVKQERLIWLQRRPNAIFSQSVSVFATVFAEPGQQHRNGICQAGNYNASTD
ncbi:hypothetical protein IWQ48_001412 [Labrenzia sp. EL_13]|nr:hypothetical protein [Labrenzia sp. EL_13]